MAIRTVHPLVAKVHYASASANLKANIGAQGGEGDMHFDLGRIAQSDAYKLLVSTVVPRPIALATTVDRDDLVDPERYYVATDKMRLVGRMYGRGWYARTSDLFLMERLSFAEWKDGKR